MVLDTSLLNTQQYKVHIKDKVEQSKEKSISLPLHLSVVAIEKEAFSLPLTTVANFTLYMYKQDLELDNIQELIYHKTQQTNQPILSLLIVC